MSPVKEIAFYGLVLVVLPSQLAEELQGSGGLDPVGSVSVQLRLGV